MRLRRAFANGHPRIGNFDISFCDPDGHSCDTVIITGANGIGKTALLELIHAACTSLKPDAPLHRSSVEFGIIWGVEVELSDEDRQSPMFGSLHGAQFPEHIQIRFVNAAPSKNLETGINVFGWSGKAWDVQLSPLIFQKMNRKPQSYMLPAKTEYQRLSNASPQHINLDDPSSPPDRLDFDAGLTDFLQRMRDQDNEQVVAWVRNNPGQVPPKELLDERVERFATAWSKMFPDKKLVLDVTHVPTFERNKRRSAIGELSSGEKQIVFRSGYLLQNLAALRNSIVIIDEPEIALHRDWQSRILSFYREIFGQGAISPQIIVATHSPEITHSVQTAKRMILERSSDPDGIKAVQTSGHVRELGLKRLAPDNLVPFIRKSRKRTILITEGESDKILIETAWGKLRPGTDLPFDIYDAGGAKNINVILREYLGCFVSKNVIGLFDFDAEYAQWNGISKEPPSGNEASGLVKTLAAGKAHAVLLPVPEFRGGYATRELGDKSILEIEHLFKDDCIKNYSRSVQLPLNQSYNLVPNGVKIQFATHAKVLDAGAFVAFEVLLKRLESLHEVGVS